MQFLDPIRQFAITIWQAVSQFILGVSGEMWISVIQTLLAAGAFWIALRELKSWRVQLLGSKKVELALEFATTAIEIRDSFRAARGVLGYGELEEDFQRRWALVQPHVQKLVKLHIQVEALMPDDDVSQHVETITKSLRKFQTAMMITLDVEKNARSHVANDDISWSREHRELIYAGGQGDELEKNVDTAVEGIVEFTRQHLRE